MKQGARRRHPATRSVAFGVTAVPPPPVRRAHGFCCGQTRLPPVPEANLEAERNGSKALENLPYLLRRCPDVAGRNPRREPRPRPATRATVAWSLARSGHRVVPITPRHVDARGHRRCTPRRRLMDPP